VIIFILIRYVSCEATEFFYNYGTSHGVGGIPRRIINIESEGISAWDIRVDSPGDNYFFRDVYIDIVLSNSTKIIVGGAKVMLYDVATD